MRWNWLVLVVGGIVALLIGTAGAIVGAWDSVASPIIYMTFGAALIVGGLVVRRWYRRYEAEAMATAAKELSDETAPPTL